MKRYFAAFAFLAIFCATAARAVMILSGASAPTYTGLGDVQSGAKFFIGFRAYNAAAAAAQVQAFAIENIAGSETCSWHVATTGGMSPTVTSCSGASSGAAMTTFCSSLGACNVADAYDQSGANWCNGSVPCNFPDSGHTTDPRPILVLSCIGGKPCMSGVAASSTVMKCIGCAGTQAQPFTISAVAERTGALTSITDVLGGNGDAVAYNNTANTWDLYAGSLQSTTSVSDSAAHSIQSVFFNSGTNAVYVDGTTLSLGGNPGNTGYVAGDNMSLLADIFGSSNCTCYLSEVALYGLDFTTGTPSINSKACANQDTYYGISHTC